MKPEQITAWALNEASAEERQQLEAALLDHPQTKQTAEETKEFCDFLLAELRDDSLAFTEEQRERLKAQPMAADVRPDGLKPELRTSWKTGMIRLALAACVVLGAFWTWNQIDTENAQEVAMADAPRFKVNLPRVPEATGKDGDGLSRRDDYQSLVLEARKLQQAATDPNTPPDERRRHSLALAETTQAIRSIEPEMLDRAESVAIERPLEAKPMMKLVDPLAGIVEDRDLAAAPALPSSQPETPRMLTINSGQTTMSVSDVVELKKLRDQNASGFKFNVNPTAAAPVAGDLVGGMIISGNSVAAGDVTLRGGSLDKSGAATLNLNGGGTYTGAAIVNGGVSRITAGTKVVFGNDVAGAPGFVGGGAGTPPQAPKPMDGTALALTRDAAIMPLANGGASGNKPAVGATLDVNGAVSMIKAGEGTLTLGGMVAPATSQPHPATLTTSSASGTVLAERGVQGPLVLPQVVTLGSGAVMEPARNEVRYFTGADVMPKDAAPTTASASSPVAMTPPPAVLGKALEQQKGIDLMTSSVVTTKTGTQATAVVTSDFVTTSPAPPPVVMSPQPDAYYFAFKEKLVERDEVLGLRPVKDARSDTESYTRILENELKDVAREPLSTFSIDVDTAAYANVRRFLNQNTIPPSDAVRIEELVNYFPTAEEGPAHDAKEPFAVRVEMAPCPWQPVHRLARIAIKGRELGDDRKNSNLVFLVDVSGSMNEPNKLPLVQQSLRMLTEQLGEGDKVTMVAYAGSSGLVLPPTNGEKKADILAAIEKLKAGGSTHGSAGIQLAYEQAVAGFIKEGVNRVILCTDGDFNVGVSSPEALETLITQKAKSGVFLSVLGFGSGNLKDRTMETLADKGNGNYAYIDSLSEARKVLVEQMSGTLVTIAKDVKIQVEFNPAAVRSYRLIGYENRMLAKEDFNDDTKDAGEIGAGHSVVALYEVVPANLPPGVEPRPAVDSLKYQAAAIAPAQLADAAKSGETMTVKLRYKEPEGETSQLIEVPTKDEGKTLTASSEEFKYSAAVAGFGLLLRDSAYKGTLSWETVRRLAIDGKGADKLGYRGEFLQLIDKARGLKETRP